MSNIGPRGQGEAPVGRVPSERPARQQAEQKGPLARRIAWADLLKRVFEVDALRSPDCGRRVRLIDVITDPDIARRILECLALPPRAPPLGPGHGIDRGIDHGAALDPTGLDQMFADARADSGSDPGFGFDQTPSEPRSSDEDG